MPAAWCALWLVLWAPRRLPLALALAAGVLLAVGLLAQLHLGLGAPESSWLHHFQQTAALLALRPLHPIRPMPQARIEALLLLLAGAALAGLLLPIQFDDETAVFNLQPWNSRSLRWPRSACNA